MEAVLFVACVAVLAYVLISRRKSAPAPVQRNAVSNAKVGDGFVYADGAWNFPDPKGKWLIRGTSENDDFGLMPMHWYLPKGQDNGRDWWTLTDTPDGLLNSASPNESAYNCSVINDAFTQTVRVADKPVVNFALTIPVFEGSKVRAMIGVSMRFPDGSSYYLERNIQRTDNFDLWDGYLDRSTNAISYFPPSEGPLDVRAMLMHVLPVEKVDSLTIAGVYIGSEIYGSGRVDVLLSDYFVEVST